MLPESRATYQNLKETISYETEVETAIAKTMELATNESIWKNKRTRINYTSQLKQIAKNTDIFNPEKVQTYILSHKKENGLDIADTTKNTQQTLYCKFAEANNIKFKPKYQHRGAPIPLIPSTENIDIIINSMPLKWYIPFKIMAETATEAQELNDITISQINKEQGTISIQGTKQHLNGTYKLSEPLAECLRKYLATHQTNQPFPKARLMGDVWLRARNKRAKELNKPELKKILMKSIRNYAGAVYYTTMGKDPIATKNFMRHKRLEQTMDYLRGLTEFTAHAKKIGKIVNTAEEALELILQGFKEESIFNQGTPQEKHILTKINI